MNRNDTWKMFDVTVEGVSFVRNFRAELDSEIRETSLDAVIERLEAEAAKFSGDAGASAEVASASE